MENFIVSARKYRPTTFDSVVGQHAITSTLKNAIKSNHLAQAFLFCGPRGVGKTTCARILAKTINCFSITENIEACNECESCKAFDEGHSLNIHELDGASNNSVDDIRGLIDQVRFAPQIGTHKVYIIDEVHMLSQAAFNAFLKTLEEPPKHAIFILATTEKHKIIPTILSRCQIFDFNRIQVDDIANHLAKIAASENVPAEQDGLHIIAQKADGALRDALSMFDQIVSFSGGNVSYQDVIENLNILDYTYYFKVTDAFIHQQVSEALLIFNEILNKGFNGHNFVNGLAEHFRNLLVCQDEKTIQLLEVGDSIKEQYLSQAKSIDIGKLVQGLDYLNEVDTKYKGSKNQRLLVEVLIMRLCSLGNEVTEKKKTLINLPFSSNETKLGQAKTSQTNSESPAPKLAEEAVLQQKTKESAIDEPVAIPVNTNSEIQPKESGIPHQTESVGSEKKQKESEIENSSESVAQQTGESDEQPTIETDAIKQVKPVSFAFADTISISSTQEKTSGKNEIEEELSLENRPEKPFSDEEFLAKWSQYKSVLEDEGRSSLASIFENNPKIEGHNVLIEVENKVLQEEFQDHLSDFLGYIREALSNYSIKIETTINQDVGLKKAYTPQEKFIKMAEKNPSLKVLVKKLDMDVGYA